MKRKNLIFRENIINNWGWVLFYITLGLVFVFVYFLTVTMYFMEKPVKTNKIKEKKKNYKDNYSEAEYNEIDGQEAYYYNDDNLQGIDRILRK